MHKITIEQLKMHKYFFEGKGEINNFKNVYAKMTVSLTYITKNQIIIIF